MLYSVARLVSTYCVVATVVNGALNDTFAPSTGFYGYDVFSDGSQFELAAGRGSVAFKNGRGSTLYAFGNNDLAGSVTLVGSYYDETNTRKYYLDSEWIEDDAVFTVLPGLPAESLGAHVDLLGDHVTGDMLWVSSTYLNSDSDPIGAINILKRFYGKWSTQAVLVEGTSEDFGLIFDVDRHHLRTAVAGCHSCATPSLFVYSATTPKADSWALDQVLTASSGYTFSLATTEIGEIAGDFVKIFDKTIIASAGDDGDADKIGALVFTQQPNGIWSQQQFLKGANDIVGATVVDNMIYLGDTQVDTTYDNSGVIRVYEPSSSVPGPKGKPVQWSQQQTLHAGATDDFEYFGSIVEVYGNTLVGTESGAVGTTNFFERDGKKWSHQQTLVDFLGDDVVQDVHFVGSEIAVVTRGDANPLATNFGGTFQSNQHWKCLFVNLEDQFGDGWDVAQLMVETPFGDVDYFAPSCITNSRTDTVRDFRFRYCPTDSSDGGLYKFSIVDGPKAKFNWEITWSVQVEGEDEFTYGDIATRMDFHFDSNTASFNKLAIKNAINYNVTCETCTAVPASTRKLAAATVAPTISYTESGNWKSLDLSTTAAAWFSNVRAGANYYISDLNGKKLHSTGTMCSSDLTESCYEDLKPGQYILRVGGHRMADKDDIAWTYCYATGSATTELIFEVKDGNCRPIYKYDLEAYCGRFLDTLVETNANIIILGVSLTNKDQLTANDALLLQTVIASVIPGVSPADVVIVSVSGIDNNTLMQVRISTNVNKLGLDGKSDSDILNVPTVVYSALLANAGVMWNSILSSSSPNSLTSITGIQVSEASFQGVSFAANTVVAKEAEFSYHKTETTSSSASVSTMAVKDMTLSMTVLGYVLVGCSVLVVAYYAVTKFSNNNSNKASESAAVEVVSVSSKAPVVHVPLANNTLSSVPVAASDSDDNIQAKGRPVKSSVVLNLNDLKQLIKDEDESLAKAMSVGHF